MPMTALLLMLAAADASPAFLQEGAPRAIRLVNLGDPALPDYSGWTARQLRVEYERLADLRPGVALPAFLIQAGLTGLAVSLFAFGIALGQFRGADEVAMIATGLGTTTSVAMLAIGSILLWRGAPDRRVYTAQMEEVQWQADQTDLAERMLNLWEQRHGRRAPPPLIIGPPPVGPPPPLTVPPPPPHSPEVSVYIPLIFARF